MGTALPENEVLEAVAKLPDWKLNGKVIVRNFEFPDFAQAMKFVIRIAEAAEQANHHPDIAISYNKVTLSLISHDSGGVTQRDLKMAGRINEIAGT